MKHSRTIDTAKLTRPQIMRKVIAATKIWLKESGYDGKISFHYVRGTYHFSNANNYMLSAKYVLETATGLEFSSLNDSMARLHPKYLD